MSSQVSQSSVNKSLSVDVEAKIPTVDISQVPPSLGSLAYNIVDNLLYVGNGTLWRQVQQGQDQLPIFPGDTVPIEPDYVIAGAGSAGCALASRLVTAGRRVIMLELGLDQATNPLATAPFAPAPFRTPTGPVQLNAFNVLFDPTVSHFNGAPTGIGDNYSLYTLWTGHGIGGGGLHYLLDWVTPVQVLIDGPLPAGAVPPGNVNTVSFSQAGGAAWNYAAVSAAVRANENFQLLTGFGTNVVGVSENIADRGTAGPMTCIQLAQPFPTQTTTSVAGNVTDAIINVASTAGFPAAGSVCILTNTNVYVTIAYTGVAANTITGCTTSGVGAFGVGNIVYLGPFIGEATIGGPTGPLGMALLTQAALHNAAPSVPGGAACPLVNDYNCNTSFASGQIQMNCVSQLQSGISNTFTRANSATSFINGITVADGNGNRIGNAANRKLIIWTRCTVLSAIRNQAVVGTYRAEGVRFLRGSELQTIRGKNLVSCLGGSNSSRFWQLSGIGPAAVLNAKNIPVQVDSQFIGNNLHTQWGPSVTIRSSNQFFTNVHFPGQSFIQYNNERRKWQNIPVVLGRTYGYFKQPPLNNALPPAVQQGSLLISGYLTYNRSRGRNYTLQNQYVGQLDFDWRFFSDVPNTGFTATIAGTTLTLVTPPTYPLVIGQRITGPGVTAGTIITATAAPQPTPGVAASYVAPAVGATYTLSVASAVGAATAMTLDVNEPSSGLSDPNSDISTCCACLDYLYQFVLAIRALDPTNTYVFDSPAGIETVMGVAGMDRWRQYSNILPYYLGVTAHEAGTVVMGATAATGAVDGNLRLYGTQNCFECSFAVAPVQNGGNPLSLIQAIGTIGATQIQAVAIP